MATIKFLYNGPKIIPKQATLYVPSVNPKSSYVYPKSCILLSCVLIIGYYVFSQAFTHANNIINLLNNDWNIFVQMSDLLSHFL